MPDLILAQLILQELHLLIALQLSNLLLSSELVLFPLDPVQLKLVLQAVELLIVFKLIQPLLSLVQLLLSLWLLVAIGSAALLLLHFVEVSLGAIQLLRALQIFKLLPLACLIELLLLLGFRSLLPDIFDLVSRPPKRALAYQANAGQK